MASGRGYGSLNKHVAIVHGLDTSITTPVAGPKMKKKKEERTPLLDSPEPLNDTYDRQRPIPRASPDLSSTTVNIPGPFGSDSMMEEIDPEDRDYNPILNRQLENPTSNCDTMIHLLKGNIGTGILAMPDAFKNAGIVVGLLGTLVMGAICTVCMHMLVKCSHELCRRVKAPSLGFPEVCETAFRTGPGPLRKCSSYVKMAINICLCVTQLGFCCVYFVFVAANLQDVVEHFLHPGLKVFSYLLMILLPVILLSWVKNLKRLAPVSLFASLVTVSGLGIIFYYILQDLPPNSSRPIVASWAQLPLFFGTAIYAFEGIGVILPLENNMKSPQDFGGYCGVLNSGMTFVAVLYTAVGYFGYLKYGDEVQGSITLNLPPGDVLAQFVRIMMALAIFLSYGLQFYVPMNILWPMIKHRFPSEKTQKYGEYFVRTALVIVTFFLAASIPNLGAVISLVGAVSSSTLALIFPPIIEIVTFWDQGFGKFRWMLWKDIFILVFGLAGFSLGTYISGKNVFFPESNM